ncbi:pheST operon leader peptide PheM [Raoultella ornithinolytica]|nr:pheST operon leader peptide PheM [Raoultella ornithinolytica]
MLLFSASFFTLAPELRRLARERRNGKQRQKASHCGGFFVYERVHSISSCRCAG